MNGINFSDIFLEKERERERDRERETRRERQRHRERPALLNRKIVLFSLNHGLHFTHLQTTRQ